MKSAGSLKALGLQYPYITERTEAFVQLLHTLIFVQLSKNERSSLAYSPHIYTKVSKSFLKNVSFFVVV